MSEPYCKSCGNPFASTSINQDLCPHCSYLDQVKVEAQPNWQQRALDAERRLGEAAKNVRAAIENIPPVYIVRVRESGVEDIYATLAVSVENFTAAKQSAERELEEVKALWLKLYPFAKHRMVCTIFNEHPNAKCNCGLSEVHDAYNKLEGRKG